MFSFYLVAMPFLPAGKQINYLAFAIPAFFIFLFLEYLLAGKLHKKHLFKHESSISNLSIGIAERLLNLLISASFYALFCWVYKHFALFQIPNTWWVWTLLLLTADLVWYWYHRLGHEVNLLWAAHIVHHQSEEFNLTVAARITVFQSLIRNIFWCLLPLAGFHPNLVITVLVVHGAYSFFTHTQMLPQIKWLEYVFITPSLHGVHHASNEKYLDKNYGDVFVFWDKLFGTFQTEEEKPSYGLTHPVKSYSFLWQHFHYYLEIIEACKSVKGWKNKIAILFGAPAVLDQNIRPKLEKVYLQHKSSSQYRFKFKIYLNVQIFLCTTLLTLITAIYHMALIGDKLFIIAFVLLTLINCGALMEQRKWIYYLECLRFLLLLCYLFWKIGIFELIIFPVILLILAEQIFRIGKIYRNYVLRYEEG